MAVPDFGGQLDPAELANLDRHLRMRDLGWAVPGDKRSTKIVGHVRGGGEIEERRAKNHWNQSAGTAGGHAPSAANGRSSAG